MANAPKLLVDEEDSVDDTTLLDMDACFTAFDRDGDDLLSLSEFMVICRALFRNDKGHVYIVPDEQIEQIFNVFDTNHDEFIDRNEFQFCWNHWIKTIVRPVSAILVVDVQNDFISGSLSISNCPAKHNGLDVIEPINRLLDAVDFDVVCCSLDWHPKDHISFIDNVKSRPLHKSSEIDADSAKVRDTVVFDGVPPIKQQLWPSHCVQDTWGAELHKDLNVQNDMILIKKGTNPDVDSYSLFFDNQRLSETTLNAQLKSKGISDVYVCGLAYDVCVWFTAKDAIDTGYRTILVEDCCRGIDPKTIADAKEEFITKNGAIVTSKEVRAMVEGRDRRPELGLKLAMELKNGKLQQIQHLNGKNSN